MTSHRFASRPLVLRAAVVFCAALVVAEGAAAQNVSGDCGDPFRNSYGPFDYRTASSDKKVLVEQHHFNAGVESLQSGTTGPLGHDIDYTLRAFPNHPRALMAMVRLGERDKTPKPRGAQFTVECYLQRATEFAPDDANVRHVRGIYFSIKRDYAKAIKELEQVIAQQPDNPNAHYNLGLAYYETNNYDRALAEAKAAQSLGFTLQGLEKKLKAKGKWTD
jgi:tetratricopeptide (TPR) repeat protein